MTDATRSSKQYVCDRCETPVTLPKALIDGGLDDPNEVICPDCTTPADRIITDTDT